MQERLDEVKAGYDELYSTAKDVVDKQMKALDKQIEDEALELAKKYSTDDSASFINGVLAKVIVDNGVK